MVRQAYRVRFTPRDTGRAVTIDYRTRRDARRAVELTHTRHAKANTDAVYVGAVEAW